MRGPLPKPLPLWGRLREGARRQARERPKGAFRPLPAIVALAAAFTVAACAGADPTPTPSPVPSATPTAEAPTATPSPTPLPPTPTATAPTPTATATVVPSTPTLEPTATATPSPTPAPTPAPTATATLAPTPTAEPPSPTPTPAPTPTPSEPLVIIDGVPFVTEVARTGAEQARGLSGRPELAAQSGMLFPMSRDVVATFWMRGMLISLDFVWIGSDCRVADLTQDVPPPDDPNQTTNLPIYSPSVPVRYVFEISAGEIAAFGIEIGDEVRFSNLDLDDQCAA